MFRGVIDLIFRDSQGRLILQDYKSKKGFTKEELPKYRRQLYLYSLYCKETTGEYPDILRFSLFRKQKNIDIPFKEEDLNESKEWCKNTVKEIREAFDYPKNPSEFFCEHLCSYRGSGLCSPYNINNK